MTELRIPLLLDATLTKKVTLPILTNGLRPDGEFVFTTVCTTFYDIFCFKFPVLIFIALRERSVKLLVCELVDCASAAL
jgi:hypothetical protein